MQVNRDLLKYFQIQYNSTRFKIIARINSHLMFD